MPEIKDFSIDRGSAYILRFPSLTPSNEFLGAFTTWTTAFELRVSPKVNSTPVLIVSGALSSEVPRANTIGVFDVQLTANQTTALERSTYYWRFCRTNSGFEDVLGKGVMTVEW